jgi:hypothetical protein
VCSTPSIFGDNTPTVGEELQYEIVKQSVARPAILIIQSIASLLIARDMEYKKKRLLYSRNNLEEAYYLLKTQLSISADFYHDSTLFSLYGTAGQGRRNSPAMWRLLVPSYWMFIKPVPT